jgi:NADPH:quinone reductase-like Zn-dependent oxidoreductase
MSPIHAPPDYSEAPDLEESPMRGAVLYGPQDIRYEERADPRIVAPTDVILKLSATCVCGSDLWPYRGVDAPQSPTPMGHEYCGVVAEVGAEVRTLRRGQFVVGSFFASDNTWAQNIEIMPKEARPPDQGMLPDFTGSILRDPMFAAMDRTHVTVGQVTFTKGARSYWHTHPAGQLLIVLSGSGWIRNGAEPSARSTQGMWSGLPPV